MHRQNKQQHMSSGFLSQIEYSNLITITHIEDRIRHNFELIVKELLQKQERDTLRDQQIQQLKESVLNLTRRTQRGPTLSTLPEKAPSDKHFHIVNNITSPNSIHDPASIPSDSGLGQQTPYQGDRINEVSENPEVLESSKNPLTFDEMEQKLLGSERRIIELEQKRSGLEDAINRLREDLDNHIHNKLVHSGTIQLQNRLEKKYNELEQQIIDARQSSNSLTETLENKVSALSESVKEGKLHADSQIAECQRKISNGLDEIESLKSKVSVESASRPARKPSTLPSPSELLISSLEEKIKKTNQQLAINMKSLKSQINDIRYIRNTKSLAEEEVSPTKDQDDSKIEGLSSKINEIKRDYQTSFKGLKEQIQQILHSIPDYTVLTDLIGQLKLQMGKKADEEGVKKMLVYLQNRVNWMLESIFRESEDDARIGKTSWNCLSCDRGLKQFRGKVGEHLSGEAMKGKKLGIKDLIPNSETVRMKSRSKMELPKMEKLEKFEKLDTLR